MNEATFLRKKMNNNKKLYRISEAAHACGISLRSDDGRFHTPFLRSDLRAGSIYSSPANVASGTFGQNN